MKDNKKLELSRIQSKNLENRINTQIWMDETTEPETENILTKNSEQKSLSYE